MPRLHILELPPFQVNHALTRRKVHGPTDHEVGTRGRRSAHEVFPASKLGVQLREHGVQFGLGEARPELGVHAAEEGAEEKRRLRDQHLHEHVDHHGEQEGSVGEAAEAVVAERVDVRLRPLRAVEGVRAVVRVQQVLGAGGGFDEHAARRGDHLGRLAERVGVEERWRGTHLAGARGLARVQDEVVVEGGWGGLGGQAEFFAEPEDALGLGVVEVVQGGFVVGYFAVGHGVVGCCFVVGHVGGVGMEE